MTDDKVKPLRKVETAPVDPEKAELMADIRAILERVQEGEITGLVGILVDTDGMNLPVAVGMFNPEAAIGGLARTIHVIQRAMDEAEDEEEG